jgi:DNA polymerase III sliding clamp (beta) subunit (PCNA family)
MKIQTQAGDLIAAIKDPSKIANTMKKGMPILGAVLFEVSGGVLTCTATRLTNTCLTRTRVEVDREGKACIPVSRLFKTLKTFDEFEDVELVWDESDWRMTVYVGDGEYVISGFDPADYATIPEANKEDLVCTLTARTMARLLEAVHPFVPKSHPKKEITGVHLTIEGGILTVEGTDAKMLLRQEVEVADNQNLDVNIDRWTCHIGPSALLGQKSVSIYNTENYLFIAGESVIVIGQKQYDSQEYPDLEGFFNPPAATLEISAPDLLGAISRAGAYSEDYESRITLVVDEHTARIKGQAPVRGLDMQEVLLGPVLVQDEDALPLEIDMNHTRLRDMVAAFSGDVEVSFVDPMKPVQVKAGDKRALCMPLAPHEEAESQVKVLHQDPA